MIEGIKLWINSMLCIGIFILFIKLIIPKNNLNKYIYSMIGIITIITVISPITKFFKNNTIEESLNQVINNISDTSVSSNVESSNINKYQDLNNQAVKMGFIEKLKEDIKTKLDSKGVVVKDIEITMNNEYEISKINIQVEKYSSLCKDKDSVATYIKNEYDIGIDKIKVRGE